MSGIELMPFEFGSRFVQSLGNLEASLQRDMRVLPSPHKKKGRPGFGETLESVIPFARPQANSSGYPSDKKLQQRSPPDESRL
jgi:hypothetical protein